MTFTPQRLSAARAVIEAARGQAMIGPTDAIDFLFEGAPAALDALGEAWAALDKIGALASAPNVGDYDRINEIARAALPGEGG